MNVALIGYGKVAKALARLLAAERARFPFRIVAVQTRRGTAIDPAGVGEAPDFGPPLPDLGEFYRRAGADAVVELTPLNPVDGEPAIHHIRTAFAHGLHAITANKGPVAHAYAGLRREALAAGVQFRFEAAVMAGVPVFHMVRTGLPGCAILGFSAVLDSTTTVVLEAMEAGLSLEEAVAKARTLGIVESDASFDLDGWDAAAKSAALANVLMDANVTPQKVDAKGIRRLTPEKLADLKSKGKTVRLVSRAHRGKDGVKLRVRAEVLDRDDALANVRGTGNLLLLETERLGTLGLMASSLGPAETAYGLFSDLVDVSRYLPPKQ